MLRSTPWPLNSSGLLWPAQVQVMVTGRPRHAHGRIVYLQYLQHLAGQIPPRTQEEHYESPYLDFLQAPLQPLMDNLESHSSVHPHHHWKREPIESQPVTMVNSLCLTKLIVLIEWCIFFASYMRSSPHVFLTRPTMAHECCH